MAGLVRFSPYNLSVAANWYESMGSGRNTHRRSRYASRDHSARRLCAATQKDGYPCWMSPLAGSRHCFQHDPSPEIVHRRRQARKRGGKNRRRYLSEPARGPALDTVDDIRDVMVRTIAELRAGRLDIPSGVALAYACQTALRAIDLAEDKPGAAHTTYFWPVDLEILALKELAQIGRRAGLRHDAYLRNLYEHAVRYTGRPRCPTESPKFRPAALAGELPEATPNVTYGFQPRPAY